MGKGGRPSLLTPEVERAIIDAVAAGVPYSHAAQAQGVKPDTATKWLQQGRQASSGRFFLFLQAITQARARAIQANVAELRQAARGGEVIASKRTTVERRLPDGTVETTTTVEERRAARDWRANAWWLARMAREDFAERVEVTGQGGGPIETRALEGWGELLARDTEARALAEQLGRRLLETGEVVEGEAVPPDSRGYSDGSDQEADRAR